MSRKKIDIHELNSANMKYYYGIPHSHTAFSTGQGTPIDAYEHARHNGLDFLIITDHNNYLIKKVKIKGTPFTKWDASQYISTKYRKKHENFLSLVGFESKTSSFGDMNIINSNTFFTGNINNIQLLFLWMLNNPNAFVTINHPHKEIQHLEYNPILNKLITSIEVGNGSYPNHYIRYEKYYYYMLDSKWKLGAVNGADNHRINFGDSENLTCFISDSLTPYSLVNAFRLRRTFSTESRTLKMHFFINKTFMGSIISEKETPLTFKIFASDTNYKISEINIITNNGHIIARISDLNLNKIKYLYKHIPSNNETWYIIKIILENDKTAISSPIFRE